MPINPPMVHDVDSRAATPPLSWSPGQPGEPGATGASDECADGACYYAVEIIDDLNNPTLSPTCDKGPRFRVDIGLEAQQNAVTVVETTMKTITIRNVPDDVFAELKRLAAQNRRSLQQQVLLLLERARVSRPESPTVVAAKLRHRLEGRDLGDTIQDVRDERAR